MRKRVSDALIEKIRRLKPEQYELSDKGNGRLYADVFSDCLRYNTTAKEWYFFNGKHWQQDTGGMIAEKKACELSDVLLMYSYDIEDEAMRRDYIRHVGRTGSRRVRKVMIDDSRHVNCIENADLDKDLYLLNCLNGVLNLKTFDFKPHSPDYLMTKIAQVEYNPAASAVVWEKFINEVLQGDVSKIEYLQKILGYTLTGDTREESCYILYGPSTRNGKSTLIETYAYMLGGTGGYAMSVSPETLSQKQNKDGRQASGDIARLDGCRFLNASEPPKKMLLDVALIKGLLGRDAITARHLYQSEFEFIPVFKLFMNVNFLPVVSDDTLFSSGRLNVITFDKHFKLEEQDKGLKDRLKEPENISGLLNWCLIGLKRYYAEGAAPPESVRAATAEYRANSDKVGNFIRECLKESKKNTTLKDVYDKYSEWCRENGFGTENKGNLRDELKAKGIFAERGTVNGKTCKNIVKGYVIFIGEPDDRQQATESGQFMSVEDHEKLPFL